MLTLAPAPTLSAALARGSALPLNLRRDLERLVVQDLALDVAAAVVFPYPRSRSERLQVWPETAGAIPAWSVLWRLLWGRSEPLRVGLVWARESGTVVLEGVPVHTLTRRSVLSAWGWQMPEPVVAALGEADWRVQERASRNRWVTRVRPALKRGGGTLREVLGDVPGLVGLGGLGGLGGVRVDSVEGLGQLVLDAGSAARWWTWWPSSTLDEALYLYARPEPRQALLEEVLRLRGELKRVSFPARKGPVYLRLLRAVPEGANFDQLREILKKSQP